VAAYETPEPDEIDKLIASDPNAHVVSGEGTVVWFVNGKALAAAKAALGRRDSGDSRPFEQDPDEIGPPRT
jgi:hypothetical protein